MPHTASRTPPPLPEVAPLWRRLMAILYDCIVLSGVLLLVAAIAYSLFGRAIQYSFGRALFQTVLFGLTYTYYSYFWMHGGQTTGMRAWRIRVLSADGQRGITPWQALLRFFVAIPSGLLAGLGFLWMLWDPRRMTWHDRYSESQIFMAPWPAKTKPAG